MYFRFTLKKIGKIVLLLLLCSFSSNFVPEATSENTNENEETLLAVDEFAEDIYHQFGTKELFFKPFKLALKGYYQLLAKGELRNPDYLTVVDFTKSCNEERMFIIDTKTWTIIHKSLVAHGMNTGEEFASTFSNLEHSHQSSLGFYLTGEIYDGKHDKSLKLDGLEPFNDQARERGVVVHAADYVSYDYIKENGRLGRSYGCPALPREGYDNVVDRIKNGSCYFIYYPEKDYLKKSKYINSKLDHKVTCEGVLVAS